MKPLYIFPNAYKILKNTQDKINLKIGCVYLDGRGKMIRIYDIVDWMGIIFYVGEYVNNREDKDNECKFLKNGSHYLYAEKEYNLIEEIN